MFDGSALYINKAALKQNLGFIRDNLSGERILSSVVKGNAYGHGIEEFVPLAEELDVRHFSVYGADEGHRVKAASKMNSEVMIMGFLNQEEMEWAIQNDVEFFVFNPDRLKRCMQLASKLNKKAKIHLEIETGLNRTGFDSGELKGLLSSLKNSSNLIELKGLCTHFSGAESMGNYLRIKDQIKKFKKTKKKLIQHGIEASLEHTCCSAAAIRFPDMRGDLLRIGILQYGFWPSNEIYIEYLNKHKSRESPLKRLISWKSSIMDISTVKMGEYIGYGSSYLAQKDTKIAIIPVGYAHGYSRSLSNLGRVLVRGQRTQIIGIINMNCMAIDVTDIEGVENGDEVVLIGNQGDLSISVSSFGDLSDLVNYELLVRLPERLPRIIE